MAVACAASGLAFGQGSSVYSPVKKIEDQGISLMGWGSGTISETDEAKFEGSYSLRITTRNLFQGGLIRFSRPVDLSSQAGDKNNLLRVILKAPTTGLTVTPGGGPMGGGGPMSGGGKSGGGGSLSGEGGPAGQGGKTGGAGQGAGATMSAPSTLRTVRFVITTTDGLKSESYVPITTSGSGEQGGWKSVAIPLATINGFSRTNKIVKEIGISGDALATLYVGEMRVYNDATPISGDVNVKEMNLALGDEREFRAMGFGGASVLRYTWDFDARDGIQVDAEGAVIKHKFRKPGDFTVTLTISDAAGLKKPYTTTMRVRVNP